MDAHRYKHVLDDKQLIDRRQTDDGQTDKTDCSTLLCACVRSDAYLHCVRIQCPQSMATGSMQGDKAHESVFVGYNSLTFAPQCIPLVIPILHLNPCDYRTCSFTSTQVMASSSVRWWGRYWVRWHWICLSPMTWLYLEWIGLVLKHYQITGIVVWVDEMLCLWKPKLCDLPVQCFTVDPLLMSMSMQ